MAGVGEALLGDRPRVLPLHAPLVNEHAHELGHADHGVRVVELEDHPIGQLLEIEPLGQHPVEEVVDGCRDEEVLLLQAQLLALGRGVLGVEHLRDVLGEGLRAHRLFVVAGVEDAQIERVGRRRPPQPEGVDPAVVVPGNHHVVRHREHVPVRNPARARDALIVVRLGAATERDRLRGLGVRELPRRAHAQPGIRLLDLLTIDEGLPEDPVLVADAVPDRRHTHGGERIDEAGSQTPEPAVTEAGFDLDLAHVIHRDAALLESVRGDLPQTRREQIVVELLAQQILRREVADRLGLLLALPRLVFEPPRHEVIAHGSRQREVLVVGIGCRQRDALIEVQVRKKLLDESVHRRGWRDHGSKSEGVGGAQGRVRVLCVGHVTKIPSRAERIIFIHRSPREVYTPVTNRAAQSGASRLQDECGIAALKLSG